MKCHPVPLLPHCDVDLALIQPPSPPLITKSVLASLRTAFQSCPVSLGGFTTVCHKKTQLQTANICKPVPLSPLGQLWNIFRGRKTEAETEQERTTHPCQTESGLLFLQERVRREERYLHLTCPLTCSLRPHLLSCLLPDREVQLYKSPARLSVTHSKHHCSQILQF